jgi:peptide deformylase
VVAAGLLARVLQHELDHLDGILFLDRVRDPSTIRSVTAAADAGSAAE